MSGSFGFVDSVRDLEARLVSTLALRPRALPRELAMIEGRYRDQRVTLVARAYASPVIRYARAVTIEGDELEIGNLLCLADVAHPLPILGVDLVGLGRDTGVVVADLSPVTASATPPNDASLPSWARPWFSNDALSVRVSLLDAPGALSAVAARVDAFLDLVTSSTPIASRAPSNAARQAGYLAAHRDEDRGLQLLAKMFEPSLAARFLREVLFPERELG